MVLAELVLFTAEYFGLVILIVNNVALTLLALRTRPALVLSAGVSGRQSD